MLQPSSCQLHSRQSADYDNNRDDNSKTDDHNEIDACNCYWRDNCDDNRAIVYADDR
jgi:hypothetical protein